MRDARKIARKEGRLGNLEFDMTTLRIDNKRARGKKLLGNLRVSDIIRKYNSFKLYYEDKLNNEEAIKKINNYFSHKH